MTRYTGVIDGSGDVWGVIIPDVPGAHGGGSSLEAAVADATSALREVAAQMIADGEPLPEPREPDVVLNEALHDVGGRQVCGVSIRLVLDKSRPVRANISLDAGLLEAIDHEAKRRGLTRSAFLASAAMDEIARGS
ncbi:MAG: type II toxin-antitoxin system HicB family antitoxin [Hyphomicrobium aestuarii]|nr:type II toxin-antitoxin system HicB family antitoxin [Hyphomicrobium aestuarii]